MHQNRILAKSGMVPCVLWALALSQAGGLTIASSEEFYARRGTDPAFESILKSGGLSRGSNSKGGVTGSRISVNEKFLRTGPNARRGIPRDIRIHTLGNSFIQRNSFAKWSRWYQEDGNTQVFRLFEGEENVRNSRKRAARIEAFSALSWRRGEWQEWVGTYTIIKPHNAAIFQVKNTENDWALQLNMRENGDIVLNHRRAPDKIIARNMTGKPFHIRIRDNGHDYELYLNGRLQGWGSYARPEGHTSFRWGMYLGNAEVRHEAMIFVTGAGINPKDYKAQLAVVAEVEKPAPDPPDTRFAVPPEGLPIPERVWTNDGGGTVRAAGRYEVGSDYVNLKVGGQWVEYPLEKLSKEDRGALLMAENFQENP